MSNADRPNSPRVISVRGARTHNLKGIDLDLPIHRLTVVTGVSGAGKSSLAFDTLYAEGQRRYVETFSPYARQFLEKLDKPDADRIDGIPPAIAVARRPARYLARATVGTISEIHHTLALLFTGLGEVVCRNCGQLVKPATPTSVAHSIDELPEGTRYQIGFPVEILPRTDRGALVASLRADGLTRVLIEGVSRSLDEPGLTLPESGSVDVIVDRLVRGKEATERRIDSLETAFARGMGRCRIIVGDDSRTFLRGWRCGHCGTDHLAPEPELFQYSGPIGACPACEGTGHTLEVDLSRVIPDPSKTIRQGAIAPWANPQYRPFLEMLLAESQSLEIPVDIPFARLDERQRTRVFEGVVGTRFRGIDGFLRELEKRDHKPAVRIFLSRWRGQRTCSACQGARLRPEALAVRIGGQNIAELAALGAHRLRAFLAGIAGAAGEAGHGRVLSQLDRRLSQLESIGLEYLRLDQPANTLSSGELQRVILTRTLASGLVNTLYVLDEPTASLHPREVQPVVESLDRLRLLGNTIVAVTHDHSLIRSAEYVVDLGPGAGDAGGRVLFAGASEQFPAATDSATAEFLSGRATMPALPSRRQVTSRVLELTGARGNNLQAIDVSFPLGVLCVVTGASGSGKSTLVAETLYPAARARLTGEPAAGSPYDQLSITADLAHVVFLDQSPLTRVARSNPVTYLKAFDEIRKTFAATHDARLRNYSAGRFSFNVDGGRCQHCRGVGVLTVDMQFLPDVTVRCPECHGTRYRPEILEIKYRGRNIAEVLDLTVRESFSFFRHRRKVQSRLRPLVEIGLDYLKLGQPISTLSGGEVQRLRFAHFLGKSLAAIARAGKPAHTLFLIDEPSVGLHPADTAKLIESLNSLVDRGHSLIVIEHNPEIMIRADWIIDLGPEGGENGGKIVAQGTPEEVARSSTLTGRVLAARLEL
jgi:excinuclease ABC subunit A